MANEVQHTWKLVAACSIFLVYMVPPALACCHSSTPQSTSPAPTTTNAPLVDGNVSCNISLEPFQLAQIRLAIKTGRFAQLRRNISFTYSNQEPIVTTFTKEQMIRIQEVYGGFGAGRRDTPKRLWPGENISYVIQSRKRRNPVILTSICPVTDIVELLVTAFNADDDPLQIVQFNGFSQYVLRQVCDISPSPHGTLTGQGQPIECQTVSRLVYLVAIRLDNAGMTQGDIAVEQVQVESCSSFF